MFRCEQCGCERDRDLNAAINLGKAKEYAVLT
ncbi:zinc ribbon domain-containing protein [Paenactinomyces guangxiensis]|nr:transposase [Paenactinomyces guangxiensis]